MRRSFARIGLVSLIVGCSAGTGAIVTDGGSSDAADASDAFTVVPPKLVMSTSSNVACAIRADRTLACWGRNGEGELGSGGGDAGQLNGAANPPREVPAVTGLSALAIGQLHACAIVNGAVWCWGSNALGQLGDPSLKPGIYEPRLVPGISQATAIAAGPMHTCAVVAGGAVKCWGTCQISTPCLGDGSSGSGMTDVSGLTGVTTLSAGLDSTCALTSAGAVYCWGADDLGQGGDGEPNSLLVKPAPVLGLQSGIKAIGHGKEFACALHGDGTVSCWGASNQYTLGNGSLTPSASPIVVPGLQGAVRLTVGYQSVCTTDAASNVKCWGQNLTHQLGPKTTNYPTPTPFGIAVDPFVDLQLGVGEACAALTTGGVRCWGIGALGDGVTTDSATPVPVLGFE